MKRINSGPDIEMHISSKRPPMTNIELLENDLAPEVQESMQLILQDLPSIKDELSVEVLQQELLKLRAEHYKASQLKSQGKSYQQIAKIMGIDAFTAKKYVERVMHLHYNLYPKEAEILTQQIVEQLDSMTSDLYDSARQLEQFNDEGEVFLSKEQILVNLSIIDRKIKVLNIEPPKRIQVELSDQVQSAQQKMRQRLESYKVIDVASTKDGNDNS